MASAVQLDGEMHQGKHEKHVTCLEKSVSYPLDFSLGMLQDNSSHEDQKVMCYEPCCAHDECEYVSGAAANSDRRLMRQVVSVAVNSGRCSHQGEARPGSSKYGVWVEWARDLAPCAVSFLLPSR